jgi:uroporphyrinogen decarboxylase
LPSLSFPAAQLWNTTVKQLVESSQLQALGMLEVAKRCKTSASLSMMDLSIEAEAFGATIKMFEMDVPTVIGHIIDNEEQVKNLIIPDVGKNRTQTSIETIRLACQLITDRPVFAGVIGPFSLAGRLMDMTEAMINCYENPIMNHQLLEKITSFLISYIKGLNKAGASGVVLAEPAAGLLSPALCQEFSSSTMILSLFITTVETLIP